MRTVALVLSLVLLASVVRADDCVTGCACGEACISCADTCRTGSGGPDPLATAVIIGVSLLVVAACGVAIWYFTTHPWAPPTEDEKAREKKAQENPEW